MFFINSKGIGVYCLALLLGCSSTKKVDFEKSNLRVSKEKELTQITSTGENSQGAFSPKGDKIIFVSRKRNSHEHGQIYELDLVNKTDRRVTYNSGVDSFPQYNPKIEIFLYASTTDSIKENFSLDQLKRSIGLITQDPAVTKSALPPTDLYIATMAGSNIRRLTTTNDFDGDARFTPDGNKILYSNEENSNISLKIFSLKKNDFEFINLANKNLRWPTKQSVQNSSLLAGIDAVTNQLIIQDLKTFQIIDRTNDASTYQQPSWHPSERKIVVSSDRKDKNNFDIFVLDLSQQCVQQITFSPALDQDPVFSPDGKNILFTSDRSGTNQLFLIVYDATQPCETVKLSP